MPKTRDSYVVSSLTDPLLAQSLTFIFARIADRLDKLEGLRGELETEGGTFAGEIDTDSVVVVDEYDVKIHEMK